MIKALQSLRDLGALARRNMVRSLPSVALAVTLFAVSGAVVGLNLHLQSGVEHLRHELRSFPRYRVVRVIAYNKERDHSKWDLDRLRDTATNHRAHLRAVRSGLIAFGRDGSDHKMAHVLVFAAPSGAEMPSWYVDVELPADAGFTGLQAGEVMLTNHGLTQLGIDQGALSERWSVCTLSDLRPDGCSRPQPVRMHAWVPRATRPDGPKALMAEETLLELLGRNIAARSGAKTAQSFSDLAARDDTTIDYIDLTLGPDVNPSSLDEQVALLQALHNDLANQGYGTQVPLLETKSDVDELDRQASTLLKVLLYGAIGCSALVAFLALIGLDARRLHESIIIRVMGVGRRAQVGVHVLQALAIGAMGTLLGTLGCIALIEFLQPISFKGHDLLTLQPTVLGKVVAIEMGVALLAALPRAVRSYVANPAKVI